MEIKVFGPGCARCIKTENLVKEVAAGIMFTPAVVIDGVVKSIGKVPAKEEIAAWIDGAAGSTAPAAGGCCCCGGDC